MPLLTTEAVAEHLNIAPRTLIAMVKNCPEKLAPPCFAVGAGTRRPEYRWRSLHDVETWLKRRDEWLRSIAPTENRGSVGKIPTEPPTPGRAKQKPPRETSSVKSSSAKTPDESGSLKSVVRSLRSGASPAPGSRTA